MPPYVGASSASSRSDVHDHADARRTTISDVLCLQHVFSVERFFARTTTSVKTCPGARLVAPEEPTAKWAASTGLAASAVASSAARSGAARRCSPWTFEPLELINGDLRESLWC